MSWNKAWLVAYIGYLLLLPTECPTRAVAQLDGGTRTRPSVRRFHVILSESEREHILEGSFQIVRNVRDLPPEAAAGLAAVFGQPTLSMADPGQDYMRTDTVGVGLPARRLAFAGVSSTKCFVHYEQGGIGHGYYVVVVNRRTPEASFVWGAAGFRRAANLEELRALIKNGGLRDDRAYGW